MYGQRATDIVGYTFHAEIYCPGHILDAVKATYPLDYPLASTILPEDTTEDILSTVAKSLRLSGRDIDPADEWSYDSDEFPKVVFASQVWNDENSCPVCVWGEPSTD